jgi:hypothetical protein
MHFGRDFIGEGNRQNPRWINVFFADEIGNPIGQNPGFPAAGTRDNPDVLGGVLTAASCLSLSKEA